MLEIIKHLEYVEDLRQESKVKHKMSDIIAITLFATIANANEWTEIYAFAEMNEEFLREHLELPNGLPSHDTIQRVMAIVNPQFLQRICKMRTRALGDREYALAFRCDIS